MKIWVIMPDSVIRRQFLPSPVASLLEARGEVEWNPSSSHITADELRQKLPSTDVVITGWGCPRIGGDVLTGEKAPALLLHTGGTVAPYVDDITYQKGVQVVSANEVYAKSVAEGVLAYMLAGLRNIPYWHSQTVSGQWHPDDFINSGLFGKRVGLTGFGAITRHLLPLLQVFQTEILLASGHMSEEDCRALGVKKSTVDEIFESCDIVSLHNALTPKTEDMADARRLRLLKDHSLFVNTARGGLVDEAALTAELATGRFFAVLDVYRQEPLPADSPLCGLSNVILMPHMAGPTIDRYPAAGMLLVEELRRFQNGEPLQHAVSASKASQMTAGG